MFGEHLKPISLNDLQEALAKAASELTGHPHICNIATVDHSNMTGTYYNLSFSEDNELLRGNLFDPSAPSEDDAKL